MCRKSIDKMSENLNYEKGIIFDDHRNNDFCGLYKTY